MSNCCVNCETIAIRAEKAEAELAVAKSFHDLAVKERDYERTVVERLRESHAQVTDGLRQAREGWKNAEAEVERLRAVLKALLDYTEQVELLAYDITEQIEIHPVVAAARAALRGGE